ncbi:hypothetical protein [Granulicella tundricola]|uniref:Uncharacterized protein n=1 Tax=Granulicella tundricola (strain ATCC BAA-1859 / DSM 23138 / MP5ACTX9) TaxID=1198114 RepID=E8X0S0_GRATM|nr:hypothetical protein [Granulicella tundricola]ADW69021.1 hypothetical protein AciX9_1975 [Granulicella tundricola MP5ACTX9]
MPRNLDPTFSASLSAPLFGPVFLVMLTFKSQTTYVWSGAGTLIWNGNTYLGVGSLGKVDSIKEGIEVHADGTSLTLSGIDKVYLGEALTDIQIGAPATIHFGNYLNGALIGAPFLIFRGCVDKPTIHTGTDTVSISLALENRMVDLQRASNRRYTATDQRAHYSDDTAFNWVEKMNDISLRWGS